MHKLRIFLKPPCCEEFSKTLEYALLTRKLNKSRPKYTNPIIEINEAPIINFLLYIPLLMLYKTNEKTNGIVVLH